MNLLKTKKISQILLSLGLSVSALVAHADVVVIANSSTSISSLSRDDVYRIYMGKMKFFPNGTKVIPIDQPVGTPARSTFYSDILHKSDSEMKAYWSRIIFTGQGNPPIQEANDFSVASTVAKNKNCIGYVDSSAANQDVKVVFRL